MQNVELMNHLKVLTNKNKGFENVIQRLHIEKLELTNQFKSIQSITDRY